MFLFDIVLIAGMAGGFYYGYKKGITKNVYELFKIFLTVSLSEAYSVKLGVYLTKSHLLMADSFAILKLIGFLILFVLFWFCWYLLEIYFSKNFEGSRNFASTLGGAFVTSFLALVFITLLSFFLTQFSFFKQNLKPVLMDGYVYPKVNRYYLKVLNNSFVDNVISGNISGKDSKEFIFKSITN